MKKSIISNKVVILTLLALVFVNILIRYPTTPHEIGVDSFVVHRYAYTIKTMGYAPWTLHSFSYLGLYPLSYPTGGPMLLSSISSLTGLNLETSILFASTLLGVFSVLTAFMFSGLFVNDNRIKLLVAFGYSLSPLLLKTTLWTFSTRGIFLAIIPLFLWTLFRYRNSETSRIRYDVLTFIFLFTLATFHRMFWIALALVIILLAVMVIVDASNVISHVTRNLRKILNATIVALITVQSIFALLFAGIVLFPELTPDSVKDILTSYGLLIFIIMITIPLIVIIFTYIGRTLKLTCWLGGIGLLVSFLSLFLIQYSPSSLFNSYWILNMAPSFINQDTARGQIIGLGVVLGARLGMFMIIGVFGIIYIPFKKRLNFNFFYLLVIATIFLPLISYVMYFYQSLSIFIFLFGGFVLIWIWEWRVNTRFRGVNKLIKKSMPVIVIAFLISSVFFSVYSLEYRYSYVDGGTDTGNYMSNDEYNVALFVRGYNIEVDEDHVRILAISGVLYNVSQDDIDWIETPKIPNLLDIQGWYTYFKYPGGVSVSYDSYTPILISVFHPSELNDRQYDCEVILFANSAIMVARDYN